jgi:chromosome partitioning protein
MIITMASEKGGVGKSTVALVLASEFQGMGYSVLVVDTDPQGTIRDWSDIAAENGHGAPTVVSMGASLPGQLPDLSKNYEITIIDCAGTDTAGLTRALKVSDLALCPCGQSAPEVFALRRTLRLVENAMLENKFLKSAIIKNKLKPRTSIGGAISEHLKDLGHGTLDAFLSNRVAYEEFIATGQGVSAYAPRSKAAAEAKALTLEVLNLISESSTNLKKEEVA